MPMIRASAAALTLALAAAPMAQAQSADDVVATVNGTEITLGHMIALRERLPEQYQQLDDQTLFDGILEQLIQQTALADAAGEPGPRTELVVENERRAMQASQSLETMAEDAVTDEAVQNAYDTAYGDAEPATEYNAAHILVETEEEAQSLIEELEGGADFAELARENSTGPSGPSGGALGWFGPGQMVPAFDEAVQDMEAGEVAGPVQTQFGWHVIRLNETRQRDIPALEEVRPQIEEQVRTEAATEAVEEAVSGATVERAETGIEPGAIRNSDLLGS